MKHFNTLKQLLLPVLLVLVAAIPAIAQPLNGTYTIGGSSPNYATVTLAVADLNTNGVSGPVTFNIRNGSYPEKVLISPVTGASATNRITFKSETNNAANVTMTATSSSYADNGIFLLNGASYITIKYLTLQNGGSTYGACVNLTSNASYDSIVNCALVMPVVSSTNQPCSGVLGYLSTSGSTPYWSGSDIVIKGNTITGGAIPICLYTGNSSTSPSNTNSVIDNNTCTNYYYMGLYLYGSGGLKIRNNTFTTNTTYTNHYCAYMYYCRNAFEFSGNTITVSQAYYGMLMTYCSGTANPATWPKIENNTITIANAPSSFYGFYPQYCDYAQFRNNTMTVTSNYTSSQYPTYIYQCNNALFEGNTINYTNTSSGSGYGYHYYNAKMKFYKNNLNFTANTGSVYPIYDAFSTSYPTGTNEYIGNKINATSTSGTVYGMQIAHPNCTIRNNIVNTATAGSNYTLYVTNPSVATTTRIENNIFHSRATGSTNYAAYISNSSATYNAILRNNVFSKTASTGWALYLYSTQYGSSDYNNIFTGAGSNLAQRAHPSSLSATTLQQWRSATSPADLNSISYDPGYTSATNLAPDAASAASWSLNGRGVQIADNSTDINGNARATVVTAGVPDIGAYEFTPTSTPPVAVATPAAPAAGTTQIFTFGQDTVATLAWPAASTVPSSISVRQYTGTAPPTIATLSTNRMYFYTDITVPAGTYNHTSNIYYKDPWMGSVAGEPALRLAKKDGSNPWIGYTLPNSTVNTSRNIITTTGNNTFGFHTGIDAGDNASAAEVTNPTKPFCVGTFMVTAKIKNTGNNILNSVKVNWSVDGIAQTQVSYTTPINTLGSGAGNEALVPLGNVTFANVPRVIKVWTSNPNNVVDAFNADDTVKVTLRSSLSGVYTVGGTSPNYTTIAAAVNDLNSYGVCGPVTFNLRNGTYNAQTILKPVEGMNSVNRVTFKSESNNAQNVTVSFNATSSLPHIFRLDSASYFTFRYLTIASTNATYGRLFEFAGDASYDSIDNCVLNTLATTSTGTTLGGVYAYNPFFGTGNTISNDSIKNGSYAIYIYGSSSNYMDNWTIAGNSIIEPYYYGTYIYYANGTKYNNNLLHRTGTSTLYYGTYLYYNNNGLEMRNNTFNFLAPITYGMAPYYCSGDPSSPATMNKITGNTVNLNNTSGTNYGMFHYYCTNDSFANNTYTGVTQGSIYFYNYNNTNCDIVNNNINLTISSGSGSNNIYSAYYHINCRILNNTFTTTHNGTGTTYQYGGMYNGGNTIKNNIFNSNATSGTIYGYNLYSSSANIFTDNEINYSTTTGTAYNYVYSTTGSEFSRNKVNITSTSGTVAGIYSYYNTGLKLMNNVVKVATSGQAFAYYGVSPGDYSSSVYNNIFHTDGTGSTNYAGYVYNSSASYSTTLRNNIFSKSNTAGYCMYVYSPLYVNSDFNNLYTAAGSNIGQTATPSTTATTLQQWRDNSKQDLNSISFNPGFVSATNLQPNPANDSSWSLNGRGEHAGFNTTDINGNPRVTTTAAGVPDIGPYEFTPTVQPPLAIPNIAPAAGTSTVYTFGQDTVAVIAWDAAATIPASVNVRQWTGTIPPSLAGNYPYFYTDIATPAGTYAHSTKLYYKDPWGGTLVGESGYRLMKKDGTNPWTAFAAPASTTNPTRNINTTTGLTNFGYHTVSDVANNASADALIEPNGYFCAPATLPIKIKIKNNGNNILNSVQIGWTANSVGQTTVSYTTPINTANSPQGNEATINMGNYTFTSSAPVAFVFYTFNPNGQNDPAKVDDTLKVTIKPGLMGTYTVGGVTPDYVTVDEAVADVNKFGICGAVVFNIRDGAYTANTMLSSPIQGSSTANRITFQSESGIAANVTLTGADLQVFNLNNISNVTLRNFSLIQTSSSTAGANVIRLDGNAAKDSIVGCILQGPVTTSSSSALAVIFASSLSGDGDVILKNQILNGAAAMYSSSTSGYNMIFDTNVINTSGYYTTYILYAYGIKFRGNTLTNTYASSAYALGIAYAGLAGNNAPEISYNTVTSAGYYSSYLYQLTGNAANRASVHHNVFTVTNVPYFYNYFAYYGNYADYYDNTFTLSSNSATNYSYNYMGCYGTNCRIFRNKQNITMANGYGFYMYNMTNSKVYNNTTTMDVFGGSTPYSMVSMEYCVSDSIFNNTFVVNSGAATIPVSLFTSASGMNVYNNVFAHKGGGPAVSGSTGAGNFDYNNYYTTSTTQFGMGAATASTLQAWRTATGYERNSLAYDPGFVSSANLHPDPTNPASWSLNGRGMHINGNNMDLDGNPRVTTLAAGVPDIGAYEFTPLTVPPSADATPATPVAGQTQTFTFGQDTVATIKWAPNSVVPNTIDVKQYTGTKAPAFPTGAGFPYYYVDISAANITYNYSGSIYYKDPWRGTTGTEGNLRLLHQVTAPGWMAYNSPMSSSDANRNIIRRDTLSATGLFTMIDDGTLFSAIASAQGNPVFCPGGSVLLYANTGVGYSYQWYFNNAIIPGANGGTYTATQAGDYRVAITNASSVTAQSNTINVVVVAAPSAVVNASGPMTYCTGGTLTLMANTGTGLSYQWKFNNVDIPGATNANYPVTQAGNYTVTVKNIGCSTTSSVQTINAGPLNVNLGTDTAFCQSLTTPLVLDAGYPGAKYVWNTADTTQTIEVSHSGTYYVKVDAGPNCIDWDTINVSVAPLPTVNGISYVKSGNTFMFSPSGEQNTKRYLWIYGGIAQDTNKNSTFTYTGTISMKVMLIVFNDCGSDTAEMELPLNVGAVSKGDINLNLYPNPASKDLIIEIDGGLSFTEVLILDGLGQVVYRGDGENHKQLTLDVSRYANGHYMIRATTSAGFTVTKPFNIVR